MENLNSITLVKFCFTNFCDYDVTVSDLYITINQQEVIKSGEFIINAQKVIKISIPFPNVYITENNYINICLNAPHKVEISFVAIKEILDSIKLHVAENFLQVDLPKEETGDDYCTNDEIMAYLEQNKDIEITNKLKNRKKKRGVKNKQIKQGNAN